MIEQILLTEKKITFEEFKALNDIEKTALTARAMKEIKDSIEDLKSSITSFNTSLYHHKIFKEKWVEILSYSPFFSDSISTLKRNISAYEEVHRSIVFRNRFFLTSFLLFVIYIGVTNVK